jgi:hypothetical protein
MTRPKPRKVWLYLGDGEDPKPLAELDHADSTKWQANLLTKEGDLVLMYRTTPYKDIASVFVAKNDARETSRTVRWPWRTAVDLCRGYRLAYPITLSELSEQPKLKGWKFLKCQQGATFRRADLKEQNAWQVLRRMLVKAAPGIQNHFHAQWSSSGPRPDVFLSYVREDKSRIERIHDFLANRKGLEVWFDRDQLEPSDEWDAHIERAINSSKAFVVCVTSNWLKSRGYAHRKELRPALRIAESRPNFIFPFPLDDCNVPDYLSRYQYDSLEEKGRKKRLESLADRIRNLPTVSRAQRG